MAALRGNAKGVKAAKASLNRAPWAVKSCKQRPPMISWDASFMPTVSIALVSFCPLGVRGNRVAKELILEVFFSRGDRVQLQEEALQPAGTVSG